MSELKSVKGSRLHIISEEELLKQNHLDGVTYRMLEQVKTELSKE